MPSCCAVAWGCGKSDLALRQVAAGGVLVADDQPRLILSANGQILTAPPEQLEPLNKTI
ncbi:MAG: hypothetical protein ORO03_09275 [Alphaproteobacteria bacterium]|nr:hypothetical protein [Alphaproteobacteria bacterium]